MRFTPGQRVKVFNDQYGTIIKLYSGKPGQDRWIVEMDDENEYRIWQDNSLEAAD